MEIPHEYQSEPLRDMLKLQSLGDADKSDQAVSAVWRWRLALRSDGIDLARIQSLDDDSVWQTVLFYAGIQNEHIKWDCPLWKQIVRVPVFIKAAELAAEGIVLEDYLRYWLSSEEKPHYRSF